MKIESKYWLGLIWLAIVLNIANVIFQAYEVVTTGTLVHEGAFAISCATIIYGGVMLHPDSRRRYSHIARLKDGLAAARQDAQSANRRAETMTHLRSVSERMLVDRSADLEAVSARVAELRDVAGSLESQLGLAREDHRALSRKYAAHMNKCPVLDSVNSHDVDKALDNAG